MFARLIETANTKSTIAPEAAPHTTSKQARRNDIWDWNVGQYRSLMEATLTALRAYSGGVEVSAHDRVTFNLDVLNPNVTPTVCTFVFNHNQTKTLLVNHPTLGWVPPGGHIEDNESPRESAERELTEETGLRGFDMWPRPACVSERALPGMGAVSMVGFVAYASERAPLHGDSEAAWFDLDNLPQAHLWRDRDLIRNAAEDIPPHTGGVQLWADYNDHTRDTAWEKVFDNYQDFLEEAEKAAADRRIVIGRSYLSG